MAQLSWPARLRTATIDIFVGCLFIAANFAGILRHLAQSERAHTLGVADILIKVSLASKAVFGTSTSVLYEWLTICFWGFWLYLGILAILALVRGRFSIMGYGILGLI